MNIVILHCHFQRGGVTQVVENHVAALTSSDDVNRVILLSSPRQSGLSDRTRRQSERISVDEMEYDDLLQNRDFSINNRTEQLASEIAGKLTNAGLNPSNTVLHWHNHSLGKNVAAPPAISKLADSGWRFLLHIHDFAEDVRPENLTRLIKATEQADTAVDRDALARFCYPVGPNIRYATLTESDANILRDLGIFSQQVVCLPNSVTLGGTIPDKEPSLAAVRQANGLPHSARWTIYPVRGIRRKNVGEFLLLSRLIPEDVFAGITLRPTTGVELRSYQRWENLAKEVAPRAIFDAGMRDGVSFLQNLAASEYVISTSVAEGFGMAYLEPWLAGRQVIARDLPTVTNDFRSSGVDLSRFYSSIRIPMSGEELLRANSEIESAYRDAVQSIPQNFRPKFSPSSESGSIDFARLISDHQVKVLQRMCRDSGYLNEIREMNFILFEQLNATPDQSMIANNAATISTRYAPRVSAERLIRLYQSLLAGGKSSTTKDWQPKTSVIESICSARTYYPCRTEQIDDET